MNKGFWGNLPRPIMALAPMYDVTDAAFRRVIAAYGKPDVMFTEFVSAEGLNSAGQPRLLPHLWYDESERPIVAQLFGSHPKAFYQAASLIKQLGFDGIDINLGCPDKGIMKQGSCAALFHTPALTQEIINQTKLGGGGLPVSVKIRIGDATIDWQNWIAGLLEAEPAAMTIHLRTRKEMSKVPAHWELMPKIMKFIIDKSGSNRPIVLGNGDVNSLIEAKQKIAATGCDGTMIGRGIFGNPWLFSPTGKAPNLIEQLKALQQHAALYEQLFTGIKPFEIMKKHFKAYVAGFDGAKELRTELMLAKNEADVRQIITKYN